MRLLNTTSLALEFFVGEAPEYAILSHRWEDEEVSFHDLLEDDTAKTMKGYAKVERSAEQAKKAGYQYIWIDTCCIDKSSSAELSEAINSMFQWYRSSARCLVYLSDVSSSSDFTKSRWFSRGWTLQELIAPREVHFFDKSWNSLGTRLDLVYTLQKTTGIDRAILLDNDLDSVPVCCKISWAASRITTRPEDLAYCLLGLVGVNMPLLYGEGAERAFQRLQEEFIRRYDDETIFAWTAEEEEVLDRPFWGLLAPLPAYFKNSAKYTIPHFKMARHGRPTEITNRGIGVALTLEPLGDDASGTQFLAPLNCSHSSEKPDDIEGAFTIILQKISEFENQYSRVRPDRIIPIESISTQPLNGAGVATRQFFVRAKPKSSNHAAGFCFNSKRTVQFQFESNSPQGPLMYPGRVEAKFDSDYPAIEYKSPVRTVHLVKVNGEHNTMSMEDFGPNKLRQRVVVGCIKLALTGWFGRDPVESGNHVELRTIFDKVLPRETYADPYLIVGFEPLPTNALGTPAGFVRPWYAFAPNNDKGALEQLVLPEAELQLSHTAPGGTPVAVEFRATSHRFRTWQEIRLVGAHK